MRDLEVFKIEYVRALGRLARQRSKEPFLHVKKNLKYDFCHLKKNWNNILNFLRRAVKFSIFLNFIFFRIKILRMLNLGISFMLKLKFWETSISKIRVSFWVVFSNCAYDTSFYYLLCQNYLFIPLHLAVSKLLPFKKQQFLF